MTPDPVLETLLEYARAEAMRRARTEELGPPILVTARATDRGEAAHPQFFMLAIPGVHPSDQAKIILHGIGATHAALCLEAWEVDLPVTPEIEAAVAARRRVTLPPSDRPSTHPDRYEVLVLIGEARGQHQLMRSWKITPGEPGQPRVFSRRPDRTGGDLAQSRFTPLFGSREQVRVLIRQYAELQGLQSQVRGRRS